MSLAAMNPPRSVRVDADTARQRTRRLGDEAGVASQTTGHTPTSTTTKSRGHEESVKRRLVFETSTITEILLMRVDKHETTKNEILEHVLYPSLCLQKKTTLSPSKWSLSHANQGFRNKLPAAHHSSGLVRPLHQRGLSRCRSEPSNRQLTSPVDAAFPLETSSSHLLPTSSRQSPTSPAPQGEAVTAVESPRGHPNRNHLTRYKENRRNSAEDAACTQGGELFPRVIRQLARTSGSVARDSCHASSRK